MLGFSKTDGIVTLQMTEDDWTSLLLMCGVALAVAMGRRHDARMANIWLGVINRLNAGNPNFTPYKVPEEPKGGGLMAPETVSTVTDELREERALLDDMIHLVEDGYIHVDDSTAVERYGLTLKGAAATGKRGPK